MEEMHEKIIERAEVTKDMLQRNNNQSRIKFSSYEIKSKPNENKEKKILTEVEMVKAKKRIIIQLIVMGTARNAIFH